MFLRLLTVPRNPLLIREWQSKSTSILGRQAKNRYISTKRNKTTLIPIEIHELPTSFVGLRQASTAVDKSVSNPGLPTSAYPTSSFLDIKIPYLSQSDPQPLVQIPYVPDFWDSSSPSIEPAPKETFPKLLVVAGAGTHHGGGPSHNLLDISSGSENSSVIVGSSSSHPKERGLWDDMADDVGLPPTKDVKSAIWKMFS